MTDSGPVKAAKATLIGPESVLVMSPKLLIVVVFAVLSIVTPAIMLYTSVDRRIEKTEEAAIIATDKLKTDVATKRDLADMGRELRVELHAVQEQAANMRMHCEPLRGGGMRCQVSRVE